MQSALQIGIMCLHRRVHEERQGYFARLMERKWAHAGGILRDVGMSSMHAQLSAQLARAQAEEEGTDEETRRREKAAHEEVTDMAYEAAGHTQGFAEAIEEEVRGSAVSCSFTPQAAPGSLTCCASQFCQSCEGAAQTLSCRFFLRVPLLLDAEHR